MIVSLAASAIGLIGSTAYYSPWVWRHGRMGLIRRDIVRNRILALTYDDGPSESVTPQILDLLGRYGATATFFMLGHNARRYPHIVERVLWGGHDIACHSDQHLNAWKVTPWRAVADIDTGYERLSSWVRPNGMFRPPYGKMTLPTYWAIRRRGASVWWWTIDSGDTGKILPRPREVALTLRCQKGGIVLMHDGARSTERNDFVLKTTVALLDLAKQESMRVMSLRDLGC